MKFSGFGHVCLVVSDFEASVAFYDKVMRHLGMKPYVAMPRLFHGWYADEYMFVIARYAQPDDHFSQFRIGLHHLSFRATSRAEVDAFAAMLNDIGAKMIRQPELGPFWPGYYSVLCEDPDGIRIEMNYLPREGWDAVAAASKLIEGNR
jgi:catechol 2,3-dioxygenase-like lactoylglutathione lyase family enzyme